MIFPLWGKSPRSGGWGPIFPPGGSPPEGREGGLASLMIVRSAEPVSARTSGRLIRPRSSRARCTVSLGASMRHPNPRPARVEPPPPSFALWATEGPPPPTGEDLSPLIFPPGGSPREAGDGGRSSPLGEVRPKGGKGASRSLMIVRSAEPMSARTSGRLIRPRSSRARCTVSLGASMRHPNPRPARVEPPPPSFALWATEGPPPPTGEDLSPLIFPLWGKSPRSGGWGPASCPCPARSP